jgi:hypothetical protein
VDPLVADLQAEGIFDLSTEPLTQKAVMCIEPCDPTPVFLFKLIVARRLREVIDKVRKQIEIVIKALSTNLCCGLGLLTMPLALQAVSNDHHL